MENKVSFSSSFRKGSKFVLVEEDIFLEAAYKVLDIRMLPTPYLEISDNKGSLFKSGEDGYVRVHQNLAFKLHAGTSAKFQSNGEYYPVEVRADFPFRFHHEDFWKKLRGS